MGERSTLKWPYLICPNCTQQVESPEDRTRLLIVPWGSYCRKCDMMFLLTGNIWKSYGIAALLLSFGGMLYSRGYHFILTAVFFAGGVAALAYGLHTSRLKPRKNAKGETLYAKVEKSDSSP